MKDPSLLQRLAILLYGIGEKSEAFRFAELAEDIGVTDGTQLFELALLEKINQIENPIEPSEDEEIDEDELADELEQFRDQLEQVLDSQLTLYWPLAFVDMAAQIATIHEEEL
ncbi:MAG: hypothetical protein R3A13_10080 [Bdellovibrionota bacterium]